MDIKNKIFIDTIAPLIVEENKKRGNPLFSSVVIAQAICETGWGKSQLMMKANAIFGIKASKNWKGKVYNAKTKECYDGSNYTDIVACFRAYNNIQESISDYFDLITKNERYRKACISNSPRECITAIKNGGYATSPEYIEIIMKLINSYDLTKYDNIDNVKTENFEEIAIDELAKRVINGEFGNGEERKQKLGNLYNEVQKRVNQLLNKDNKIIYVVQKGDCLCNIAKKFGVSVEKIAKDNDITNVDLIYPKQILVIRR